MKLKKSLICEDNVKKFLLHLFMDYLNGLIIRKQTIFMIIV